VTFCNGSTAIEALFAGNQQKSAAEDCRHCSGLQLFSTAKSAMGAACAGGPRTGLATRSRAGRSTTAVGSAGDFRRGATEMSEKRRKQALGDILEICRVRIAELSFN